MRQSCHTNFRRLEQRVSIPIDESLLNLTEQLVAKARMTAQQSALRCSHQQPKMSRCSLSHICLPDETIVADQSSSRRTILRSPPTNNSSRRQGPLYMNKQGLYVARLPSFANQTRRPSDTRSSTARTESSQSVRNIQFSNQLSKTLLELEVPLVMFRSMVTSTECYKAPV